MATCTFRVGTADTGNTPNTSGAFTPAVGDLLVAFCIGSGQTNDSATLASSVGGFTFSQVTGAVASFTASGHRMYVFVSDQLVTSATSQTVDFTPGTQANGSHIFVYSVSGLTRRGLIAVRQTKTLSTQTNGTPAVTFDAAALTDNPTFAFFGNNTSPAGTTAPSSWTENASGDLGYSNPTIGGSIASRDSGFTGTTITWGASTTSNWAAIIVEIDSSAYTIAPAVGTGTFTGYAPTLSVAGGGTTISVGAGSGTFTGYAATTDPKINVGAGSGTFTGYAPETKYAQVHPAAGSGSFTGYAPSALVTENQWATPGVGSGTFQGYAPDLVAPGAIIPDAGIGTFTGYEPTLLEETLAVETPYQETPAGRGKRRRREQYHVEIDGQTFVGTYEQIAEILRRAK